MLCHDLFAVCDELPMPVKGEGSFVACFKGASSADERLFEVALWQQLHAAHDVDKHHFGLRSDVGMRPASE